jgi:hypothetical protein
VSATQDGPDKPPKDKPPKDPKPKKDPPMATLTVTTQNHGTGIMDLVATAVAVDVGGSDKYPNTGNEMVIVNNGSGGALTVTENYGVGGTIDGQVLPNKTKIVAAGKVALLGPYPPGLYNDANGFMTLSWSATTTIKVLPFVKGS